MPARIKAVIDANGGSTKYYVIYNIIKSFFTHCKYVFCNFGPPSHLLSDNGTHFVSQDVESFVKFVNTHHQYATPYHPQTNGRVEQFKGTMVKGLKKLAMDHPKHWDNFLPTVLYAYRTKCHQAVGISPFELLYGIAPRVPEQDVLQKLGQKLGMERLFYLQQRNNRPEVESETSTPVSSSEPLPIGTEVIRLNLHKKNKLDRHYKEKVYFVLCSHPNNVYKLVGENGVRLKRAVNGAHLKKFVRHKSQTNVSLE